jgi:hypothetical protein
MTDSQHKQIQEIEALLAERRKFEQWIVQLEARRASTPEHVYSKVLGDYRARLDETQGKLSAESGVVQKLVSELATSLASHERQIAEKRDERAEAELRAAVGEYTEKEWEKLRVKLDGVIATVSGERDSVEREHDTLRALLNEATTPSQSPVATVANVKTAEVTVPRPIMDSAKSAEPAAPVGAPPKKSDVDELAFLRSVLGRSTPYTASGGQPAVSAPVAEPVRTKESSSARSSGGSAPKASEEKEQRKSGSLSTTTPRESDAVKTLKCQECGTMNFPTEWYCERCGGELAAF